VELLQVADLLLCEVGENGGVEDDSAFVNDDGRVFEQRSRPFVSRSRLRGSDVGLWDGRDDNGHGLVRVVATCSGRAGNAHGHGCRRAWLGLNGLSGLEDDGLWLAKVDAVKEMQVFGVHAPVCEGASRIIAPRIRGFYKRAVEREVMADGILRKDTP
jgi:hypothetical protein